MSDFVGPLFVLLCIALVVGPLLIMKRVHRRRMHEVELRAPLLNSTDHRLDAALREAGEGYNVCGACGFENFKRSTFCTICGDAMVDPKEATEVKKQQTKSQEGENDETGVGVETKMSVTSTRLEEQQHVRGRRQRRARKRKEWARRVDVEGKMYWYRAKTDVETKGWRFPGFVLEVTSTTATAREAEETAPESDGAQSIEVTMTLTESTDEGSECIEPQPAQSPKQSTVGSDQPSQEPEPRVGEDKDRSDEQEHEPTSLEERRQQLVAEFGTIKFDLVDASAADPTRLPLAPHSLSDVTRQDVLTISSANFPSKYANFVTCTAGLLIPSESGHMRMSVNRADVYQQSMESLSVIGKQHVRSVLRINFLDENGIDAGGVHREWFQLVIEKMVDPSSGLFRCVDRSEQTYFLNPHSERILGENHLVYFFTAGRMLGRALLEGYATGFHLSLPLLKIILGIPVSFSDLEFFDPELYKSLMWMVEHEGVDALGLDFTVSDRVGDAVVVADLVSNGSEIAVTDENKMTYVERRFKYMLFESVSAQLYALLKGLFEVIPQELLMVFDPEELDYILCGSDEIDVDDWERNTKYTEDLHEHRALRWFWELVREMPNEYRRRLLVFATGSSRVPLAGFSALTSYDGKLCPFTLKGVKLVDDGYIMGHACFNRLDLPLHVVRDELKAVLYATLETDLYGFTTD